MKIWPLEGGESYAIEAHEGTCPWCYAAYITNALPDDNMIIFLTNGKEIYEVIRINNSIACRKSNQEN